jgi:hypothetical protein
MAMTAIFAATLSWWRMWREHFLPKKGGQRQLLQSSQGDGLRRNKFWWSPIFHSHPPQLTLLKVMAHGAPMKNFGGNKMFAVFDLLKYVTLTNDIDN